MAKMEYLNKTDGTTFERWMVDVNYRLMLLTSLASDDMVDCAYWDYWDSDMDSQQAALEALSEQDFFSVSELQSMGWEG
jgi:hypothetical protein